jgi:hypothetical protein
VYTATTQIAAISFKTSPSGSVLLSNYFEPTHAEFASRTMWSLSNAFTFALELLDPIPFFRPILFIVAING